MRTNSVLLQVAGLKTYFPLDEGTVKAVDGADFVIRRGETLCVVGESGCGKSVTARSILQILDRPGRIVEGKILLHREPGDGDGDADEVIDLASLSPRGREMRDIRGREIAMIFQEPMTSLSPLYTIGNQIMEAVQLHTGASKKEARSQAVETLRRVGIPKAEQRVDDYPFQLSGGMRQRAMIAMALVCNPALLIADEPTTALDVTTQAQILDLILGLQRDLGMALQLITHDLGVVAETADDVVVMYLGISVERGPVRAIFHDAKHPYTRALLHSIPMLRREGHSRLACIRGMVPDPYNRPTGCLFHPRCDQFIAGLCDQRTPPPTQAGDEHQVSCFLYGGE
jgi:oligopeptide/dipeptide ABC transporter ATP-binding protein